MGLAKALARGLGRNLAHKRAPFLWPAWREGKPEWQIVDLASYIEEGFNVNSLVYSCVMYKARAVRASPLRGYQGDPQHPEMLPAGDDLSRLLDRPNPNQSGPGFQSLCQVYYNVAGNNYVRFVRPVSGGLPTEMYALRPDRVWIVPSDGGIKGYIYTPEGRTATEALEGLQAGKGMAILPQDLMHTKLPNPGDPLEGLGYGLSPVSALARSGDVDNQVTRFLQIFFQKGTMAQGTLSFNVPMTDEEVAAARTRWQEVYGGVDNWSKIAVLDQGGKFERIGLTFDEMGFESIDERNETRIAGPFGVPLILVGARVGLMRSTYENFESARRQFWQDVMVPDLELFEADWRYFLSDENGRKYPAYDLSDVPALQQDKPKLVQAAKSMFDMGTPARVAYTAVGLDVERYEGDDKGYLPLNLVPVGTPRVAPALPSANQPPGKPTPKPEPESEGQEEEQSAEGQAQAEEQQQEAGGKGVLPFRR